ncbi:hypothetical protein K1719_031950 [Acacia pycnantha]|nr:hypothetical protein K1719_031950 [Acacia pycnantha]
MTDQVMHGVMNEGTQQEWGLSFVYGSLDSMKQRSLWSTLSCIAESNIPRWCVCGDFNATLRDDERMSIGSQGVHADNYFRRWVSEYGLSDLEFSGPKFTWSRYHSPLLLRLLGDREARRCERPFQFFAPWVVTKILVTWLRLKSVWVPSRSWEENVGSFVNSVRCWNREVLGDINRKKSHLLRCMDGINKKLERDPTNDDLEDRKGHLWVQLEEIFVQEEIINVVATVTVQLV